MLLANSARNFFWTNNFAGSRSPTAIPSPVAQRHRFSGSVQRQCIPQIAAFIPSKTTLACGNLRDTLLQVMKKQWILVALIGVYLRANAQFTYTTLDPPGATWPGTEANGISGNNVVGTYSDNTPPFLSS
jgi:hypothetical protein